MVNRIRVLIVIGVVGAIVIGRFIYEASIFEKTDNAQVQAHTVMLAPKLSGQIIEVNVAEGQKVREGDVLVRLDDRDYQNALSQVKGDMASSAAKMRDAEKNYKRLVGLFAKGAVPQQQFDTANASYFEAKAKYEAAQAQVAQAELNLINTKILSPFNGFVARKSAEKGQLATAGVPLLGMVDSGERWIMANFKETEIEDIKIGHKVDVSVDAISGRSYTGQVESISSATGATFSLLPPDNATGNFTKVVQRVPVKIKLVGLGEDDIVLLKAGLSANVKVHKK